MLRRKSECKSNCTATDPIIRDYEHSLLPNEVQKKLNELGLERETLKQCSYCGDIWIEKSELVGTSFHSRVIKVGIDNRVAGEGMIWRIMDF